jgi:hypothetical protein
MLFHRFIQPRRVFAVAAAAVATVVAVTACGNSVAAPRAGGPTLVVIHDTANGTTVPVRAGERVELILSSSYWDVTGSSSPRVLRQDGATVLMPRPNSCPDIPGLGCTPLRTEFTALADGKAVIKAWRSSCGEALRCRPDQTRFTVTVVVRHQS